MDARDPSNPRLAPQSSSCLRPSSLTIIPPPAVILSPKRHPGESRDLPRLYRPTRRTHPHPRSGARPVRTPGALNPDAPIKLNCKNRVASVRTPYSSLGQTTAQTGRTSHHTAPHKPRKTAAHAAFSYTNRFGYNAPMPRSTLTSQRNAITPQPKPPRSRQSPAASRHRTTAPDARRPSPVPPRSHAPRTSWSKTALPANRGSRAATGSARR